MHTSQSHKIERYDWFWAQMMSFYRNNVHWSSSSSSHPGSGLGLIVESLLETASALFVIRCSLPILQAFISRRSQKNHFRDFNLNNTVMNQARSGGIASQTHSSISPGVTAPWLGIKPMRLPKPGKINPALRECRVRDEARGCPGLCWDIRRRSPLLVWSGP